MLANRLLKGAAAFSIALALMSCTSEYTKKFEGSAKDYGSTEATRKAERNKDAMFGLQISGGNNHNNKKLAFSQTLSNTVGEIPGVRGAVVMVTDRNAYAAILIDYTASGTTVRGAELETDRTGMRDGLYYTDTGSGYADPNKIATGINNYVTVRDHEDLSFAFKQKIAERIRKSEPYVKEVHISANRDFINKMNVYATQARRGDSLAGYVEQFNETAVHYFGVKP